MSEIDILSIDVNIHRNFEIEQEKLSEYSERLEEIAQTMELEGLRPRVRATLQRDCKQLQSKILDIQTHSSINFYMAESTVLLERYRTILEAPIKLNFVGRPSRRSREKQRVISEYLEVAKRYIEIDVNLSTKKSVRCPNCQNKKEFDIIDGNIYICLVCSSQQMLLKHISSYKDIDRVNISSKYMYDRKVHFRDCINQYQGKQNSTIPQNIYDDLEEQFERHHLLVDTDHKETRFSRITKEHVSMFLRELEYTKHYENVNLIHYNFTGIKPDNISHLEDKLLDDFDALTELYDRRFKHIERKNFINTQYVLFQLLRRHKHKCNNEAFTILKTIDRKSFHDDICRTLFEELGWNHTPYF